MSLSLSELVRIALEEDIPQGDLTTDSLDIPFVEGKAILLAKQDLILSGRDAFTETFKQISPKTQIEWKIGDGQRVTKGTAVAQISGPLGEILKAERVALNFLGKLSGVATLTSKFVEAAQGTSTKILDTRKTTPLFRALEKKAVVDGGGANHRLNLSVAVLVKDNHIRAVGSIAEAVRRIRQRTGRSPLEVEVTNLKELKEALNCQVERVLLDNMSTDLIGQAMNLIRQAEYKCATEASGNMTLERVKELSRMGVDFISVGALTHSAPVADLSLEFQ